MVNQRTFNWYISEKRQLILKVKGFEQTEMHSYSKQWNDYEIEVDVTKTLVNKLKDFDITILKEL